ncbi:twin-arginine translocase TatA/TatE family subunit [Mucilaginibacter achroorhodeus]|uniref:Sec-independent protein translocase protein TatA n=1 Tax=Mucilaginibacter achroorhodeus TaxID=2599294 RepID=A0A563U1D3_9SPHI|nr:twin-arginine translocase TatA/TatE family subunit [Mucilaginibacter achroorhodeus]TWR24852.1 twin-arginine translocase TatA/TatE family subunit [Mucilaginibacter achroorhodeus]
MLSFVPLFLNIGTPEMILILFVALMLFGGNKLPELARGLGKGIREFKDASEDVKREINNQINNYEDKKTVEKPAITAEEENNTAANYKPYEPVEGAISAYTGHSATDAIEEHTEEHKIEGSTPAADATFENETEIKPVAEAKPASHINLTKPEEVAAEKRTTEE